EKGCKTDNEEPLDPQDQDHDEAPDPVEPILPGLRWAQRYATSRIPPVRNTSPRTNHDTDSSIAPPPRPNGPATIPPQPSQRSGSPRKNVSTPVMTPAITNRQAALGPLGGGAGAPAG